MWVLRLDLPRGDLESRKSLFFPLLSQVISDYRSSPYGKVFCPKKNLLGKFVRQWWQAIRTGPAKYSSNSGESWDMIVSVLGFILFYIHGGWWYWRQTCEDTYLSAMSQVQVAVWFGSLWMEDPSPFVHPECSEWLKPWAAVTSLWLPST